MPGGGISNELDFTIRAIYQFEELKQLPITQLNNSMPKIFTRDHRFFVSTIAVNETNSTVLLTKSPDNGETYTNTEIMEDVRGEFGRVISHWFSYDLNNNYLFYTAVKFEDFYKIKGYLSVDDAQSFNELIIQPIETINEIKDFKSSSFGSENVFSVWSAYNEDGVGLVHFNFTRDLGFNFSDVVQ